MAVTSIGNMREVVVFKQNTPVASGAGWADVYTTLCTTRGQLIDSSGSRALSFGAVADNSSFRLRVRFQTAIANAIRSDTKIVIDGTTYTHTGYKLIDQKKHLYEFNIQCQQP